MEQLCIKCKGKGLCKKPCKILSKFIDSAPRIKTHFSGSSPPEIFVGHANYPNVFSGILSPAQYGETEIFSIPELWVKNNLSIEKILEYRGQMIYGRSMGNIKAQQKLNSSMQEFAMASKSVSAEFFLKKKPILNFTPSKIFSIMANPAPIEKVILEENPKVEKKVDYLVSDYDVKATAALEELYKSSIQTSYLQKLLSAGLLGVKSQRKLVPTRWAITAIDDILSKKLLEKIKSYSEIDEMQIFSSEYNGNHYEFLVLPSMFSFEVIEAEMPENMWNQSQKLFFMQDYEGFFSRKKYASNVAGAYYANRLGVCEYLEKIKKQASILILREVRPEYYAPLGVGILREITRKAFEQNPEKPNSLQEAFGLMQSRMKININEYLKNSRIIKDYGKQKTLKQFF
ncbi:MAG: hypothetical protein ACOYT4_04910 [Nanoarchaeota archaeon]